MAELKKDQKPKKTRSKRLMPDQVAYSRFETMPGRQAQVDLAAFKITEPSGRTSTVYLFLMLLGYCRAMYGEFVQRCTQESFLDCHKRAFHYLGGVPDEVLYDNMQVHFNINLQHLAHHFGFTPKVCPPYCSRVKGQGGTSRRLHSRELLARLRVQLDRAGEPGSVCLARQGGQHPRPCMSPAADRRTLAAGEGQSPQASRCGNILNF